MKCRLCRPKQAVGFDSKLYFTKDIVDDSFVPRNGPSEHAENCLHIVL